MTSCFTPMIQTSIIICITLTISTPSTNRRNNIPIFEGQAIDFWLEYKKDPDVEVQLVITQNPIQKFRLQVIRSHL